MPKTKNGFLIDDNMTRYTAVKKKPEKPEEKEKKTSKKTTKK